MQLHSDRSLDKARQATAEDYILLTTRAVIGTTAPGAPSPVNVYGILIH
jgi:hypothetical protein